MSYFSLKNRTLGQKITILFGVILLHAFFTGIFSSTVSWIYCFFYLLIALACFLTGAAPYKKVNTDTDDFDSHDFDNEDFWEE